MRISVKHPRILGGKLLHKGQHDVPDSLKDDWFFKEMVKVEDVVILSEPKVEPKVEPKEEAAPAAPQADSKPEVQSKGKSR